MNKGCMFVYGTLKVDSGPESFARYFDSVRIKVTKHVVVRGVLYDLGYFPAIILGGDDFVTGELHEYGRFSQVLVLMDKIEGYVGASSPNNLYRRVKTEVLLDDMRTIVTATVYEFDQPVEGYPKVEDGLWVIDGLTNAGGSD